jgi:hypothetical protein
MMEEEDRKRIIHTTGLLALSIIVATVLIFILFRVKH